MKKMLLLLAVLIISTQQTIAKKTEIQISKIYNNVSKDLLSLKKEHPQTQPKVYSLLDQVCKMYKLSKNSIGKKKLLKNKLSTSNKESSILKVENLTLKTNIKKLITKLNLTKKDLETKTKKLTKNNLMLTIVNKEKESMQGQLKELQEEQKQLILKTSEEFRNDKNKNVSTNKSQPILTNEHESLLQSVNLTST